MAICVQFLPKEEAVIIGGIKYSKKQLQEKIPKSRSEQNVLRTLEAYIAELPENIAQIEIEYDDVTQLVMSDMFKGDTHSQGLLN